jgi:hypothetical protein
MQTSASPIPAPHPIGRRAALRRVGAILAGIGTTGCARDVVLHVLYPDAGDLQPDFVWRILTAFVATVVPGSDAPGRIARLFTDPSLPMAEFHHVLAADLVRRTRDRASHDRFDLLEPRERAAAIADGLAAGGVAGRLYNGAVLFTQVMIYAGLGSDDGGCPLIGFAGPFHFRGYVEQTYPDPEHFLAPALTPDGNPW